MTPNLPSICRMRHVSGKTIPIDWLSNERNMELRFIGKFNRCAALRIRKCGVIFPPSTVIHNSCFAVYSKCVECISLFMFIAFRYSMRERIERKRNKKKWNFSFLFFSAKKLAKQVERLQIQLSDEKSRNRELSAQFTEAADYKARIIYESLYFLIIRYIRICASQNILGMEFCATAWLMTIACKNNTLLLPALAILDR